jgi:hypothetical protein
VLQIDIVHNHVPVLSRNLSGFPINHLDLRSVQIDLVIHNEERVGLVHHVVIDRDTVQILSQQILDEHVLLVELFLLLLNGHFVEQHLVVAFVEVVEQLELVVVVSG